MLELLEEEFRISMGLLGVTRVNEITANHVESCQPLPFGHPMCSAFPLLRDIEF
jgi:hypothetical protein